MKGYTPPPRLSLSNEPQPITRSITITEGISVKDLAEKLGVPLAGDDAEAVQVAAQLVRDAGCEPVIVGRLAACKSFDRDGPGWRANTTAPNTRMPGTIMRSMRMTTGTATRPRTSVSYSRS